MKSRPRLVSTASMSARQTYPLRLVVVKASTRTSHTCSRPTSAVVAACTKHGITAGIHTATPAFAARMSEFGFRFITLVGDFNFILAGRAAVRQTRSLLEAPTK